MDRPMFSDMLAERRRELGYSIRQASRVLRLREDVLIAFEEGDFEQMPKSGYAQGMISSYARYLGLDANMVVDAYVRDLENYRHGERRRGKGTKPQGRARRKSSNRLEPAQTYEGPRGLLPTSGGLAGDMGSFATTRVHTRMGVSRDEDYDDSDEYVSTPRSHTTRTPARSRRAYRDDTRGGRRDIETMSVEGYQDDLRLGYDAQPYETTSSRAGRRASRDAGAVQRPRVNRRSRTSDANRRSRDRGGRSASGRGAPQGALGGLLGGSSVRIGVIAVILVVVILSVILIVSVSSCVNSGSNTTKTVPVSTAGASTSSTAEKSSSSSASSSASSSKEQSSSSSSSKSSTSSSSSSTSSSSSSKSEAVKTTVSVKVEDGAVTWLEIECDGKSDVAETVTGPWQKTYTVEDAITVQAGDTTAVSVIQDGKQVQFESMASGIGTVRIQGTKNSSTSQKDSSSSSSESSTSASAKVGNASSEGSQTDEDQTSEESYGYETESYDEYGTYDETYGDTSQY